MLFFVRSKSYSYMYLPTQLFTQTHGHTEIAMDTLTNTDTPMRQWFPVYGIRLKGTNITI